MKNINYKFKSTKTLIRMLRKEVDVSMELFRQTRNPIYNTYSTYCEMVINKYSNYNKQQIKRVKFTNLKEFVLNEWVKYETNINAWSLQKDFSVLDTTVEIPTLYAKIKRIASDRLGQEFFNTSQLQ